MARNLCVWIAGFFGVALCLTAQPTLAQVEVYQYGASTGATDGVQPKPSNEYSPRNHFFVEFIARSAASYGHMYVMYGEANARHEIVRSQIAGFFPAGDTQENPNGSFYYWSLGHIVPVPSEIGASDGDLEEQYVIARYRVWIDAAQYKRLVAYIEDRKANKGPWNAFVNNCVTFGRDVALFVGIKVPALFAITPSVVMYPETLVEVLRDANGGEKDQGPLRDAPGLLPPEIAAQFGPPSPSAGRSAGKRVAAKGTTQPRRNP